MATNIHQSYNNSQGQHVLMKDFLLTGSGKITRDELGSFYSSMLAFTPQRVGEILDEAYKALTSVKFVSNCCYYPC